MIVISASPPEQATAAYEMIVITCRVTSMSPCCCWEPLLGTYGVYRGACAAAPRMYTTVVRARVRVHML